MKRKRFGFTLIEVAIFLAISGLLLAGMIAGTQNSLWHQRFNDATQSFAEFMRSVYSQVSNPQSIGEGRGEIAIYGKLVVFGEKVGLDGTDFDFDEDGQPTSQRVFVYDVVGNVIGTGTGDARTLLYNLGANVVVATEWESSGVASYVKHVEPAGIVQSYAPRWAASIENVDGTAYEGSILVVRHPRSGTINTLVSDEAIQVNEQIRDINNGPPGATNNEKYKNILIKYLDSNTPNNFRPATVDFCINPYGIEVDSEIRRDIRLVENARNASGVEIIDLDGINNVCREGAGL